ncbi:MAG: FKBP-type peptidyl-prolyl cis-trans isomerase [Bacteroidales bacterium]|nr:FKBP-type peptidyl-prolyl cis-trans isomerase [Bacteroidales bacterium]
MQIGPNKTAKLIYTLTTVQDGKIIEKVSEEKPAAFQFGIGQLLPAFEKNLSGLEATDEFSFILKSEDAYGPGDPYAIFDIPLDTFEVDGKTDEKMLRVGNTIPMTDNDGNKHLGKITKVMAHAVTLDFNHPLAGKDLRFSGKVLEVTG